jgi:hypothetical protein
LTWLLALQVGGWVDGGAGVSSSTDQRRAVMSRAPGSTELVSEGFERERAVLAGERRARLAALWEMTVRERVVAMRNGELSLELCAAWAERYPEQVPLINGEFEYLAAFTPEVCE